MDTRVDLGFTHVALPVTELQASVGFYTRYANMRVIHHRTDAESGSEVVWLTDQTRSFVIVLIKSAWIPGRLRPLGHLGVALASREQVDQLCEVARHEGREVSGPADSGYPVGYWALISDPDGHTLELSFGQDIAFTIEKSAGDLKP